MTTRRPISKDVFEVYHGKMVFLHWPHWHTRISWKCQFDGSNRNNWLYRAYGQRWLLRAYGRHLVFRAYGQHWLLRAHGRHWLFWAYG